MLEYNEILTKKIILVDGEPYEVIDAHIFRMQQRKPQNKVKLKGVINNRVVELTFHQSEKAEEAEIEEKEVKYMYQSRGDWWFSAPNNPADRFKLSEEILGEGRRFLKVGSIVTARIFDGKIFGIKLPITVELKVTEAPDAVRGDSSKGGTKNVTVETGAVVMAPLFVSEGDIIKINTDTGEYRERMN